MKSKIILLLLLFFTFCNTANSNVVSNEEFGYKLEVDELCDVEFLKDVNSSVVITSPDGMSQFYIVCIKTGDYETVYSNDVLETFDSDFFEDLNQKPTRTESYFWLSKEDHYYNLDDGTKCKTRILLWNDKACLLAGFSSDDNMDFIEKCMDDFESPLTLGKMATLIYVIVFFVLIIIGMILWEDKKALAVLYILLVAAGWYYFHWVLDLSVNHFVLSWFS